MAAFTECDICKKHHRDEPKKAPSERQAPPTWSKVSLVAKLEGAAKTDGMTLYFEREVCVGGRCARTAYEQMNAELVELLPTSLKG